MKSCGLGFLFGRPGFLSIPIAAFFASVIPACLAVTAGGVHQELGT